MTGKVEAAFLRAQLKLRKTIRKFDEPKFEVWSTTLGSQHLFRWMVVSESVYNWYKGDFSKEHKLTIPEEIINERTEGAVTRRTKG